MALFGDQVRGCFEGRAAPCHSPVRSVEIAGGLYGGLPVGQSGRNSSVVNGCYRILMVSLQYIFMVRSKSF